MKKFNLRKKILALTLTAITMFSTIAGLLPGGVVHAADATSGTYYGIDWDMDADGNLTLNSGTCTNVKGTKWNAADIKTVKCKGKIICNDWFCSNYLFYDSSNLVSADLSGFDTSNVTSMYGMFEGCESLTSLNVSNFDTSNVVGMVSMFYGCKNLTSLDLSSFDISNATYTDLMLTGCNKLEILTTPKIVGTTHISLGTMYDDFNNTYKTLVGNNVVLYRSLRPNVYYGIKWQLDGEGNLTLSGGTCNNTQGTKWNSTDVKTVKCDGEIVCNDYFCKGLFSRHSNLVSADLSGFNTNNVTNMSNMFAYCSALTTLDISNFNTSNVTSMESMFKNCSSLESLDLSNFDTPNVTNMGSMFKGCSSLKSLDLSSFNMNACSTYYMFIDTAKSLETLKTPKVKPQDTYGIALPYRMYDNENKKYYSTLDVENVTLQKEPTYPKEETVVHTIDFFHTPLFNIQMELNGTPNSVFADDEDFLKNTSAFCLLDSISDNYGNSEYNIPGIVATEQGKEFVFSSIKPYISEDELNAYEQYTVVIDESDIKIDYITKLVNENGSVIQTLPEGKCYIQVTINYNGVEYKAFVGYNDPEIFNLLPNNVESTTTDSIEASYDENNNLVVKANQTDIYTSGKKVTKTIDVDTYGVKDQGTTLLITYDGASTEIEKIVNIEGTLLYNDGTPVQKKVVKLSTPKDMFDLSSNEGHYEFLNVPLTNNVMPLSVFDTDDTSACSDDILLTSGVVTFDNTGAPVLDNDSSKEMTLVIEKVTPTVPEREEVIVPTPEVIPTPKPSTTTAIVVPGPVVDNTNIVGNTNTESTQNIETSAPTEKIAVNTPEESTKPEIKNTASKNDTISEKPEQNNEKLTNFSKNSEKDNSAVKDDTEDKIEQSSLSESKDTESINNIIIVIACILIILFFAWLIHSLRKNAKL